ncbi:hypothetical protein IFM89_006857 [Coptis chinensis]|uniref:MoaB/Mog domain-containing protein n=1 Tax=Coptis chinensis TaxID=261450 RepID=A0A835LAC1_9MAGN|nr:hypothetical protein IFM89_006857 [Coptis chinensis]
MIRVTLLSEVYMIWYQICYCTCISESSKRDHFRPAYLLTDGRLERAGRAKRYTPPASGSVPVVSNGLNSIDPHQNSTLTASIITVGDEIFSGLALVRTNWDRHCVESFTLLARLYHKLLLFGMKLHISFYILEVDSVAELVEKEKSANDMLFIFGGVGPLHSDITVAGIAKAFGVRMVLLHLLRAGYILQVGKPDDSDGIIYFGNLFSLLIRTACLKLEEFQTAKAALEAGASLAPGDARFSNLIKECDQRIAEELGDLTKQPVGNVAPVAASPSVSANSADGKSHENSTLSH